MDQAVPIYGAFFAIALMSMVLHEYAHAYVASLCGDHTAEAMGRLTLNPIKHIDLFMTILIPALLIWAHAPVFGGAKPVPINPYNFRRRRVDSRLVSAAGVVTNLTIAVALSIVLRLSLATGVFTFDYAHPNATSLGVHVLVMGIAFNLMLFVFNLVPIPPLDGSRILRSYLSSEIEALFDRLDRIGLLLVFGFIYLFPGAIFPVIYALWTHVLQLDVTMIYAAGF